LRAIRSIAKDGLTMKTNLRVLPQALNYCAALCLALATTPVAQAQALYTGSLVSNTDQPVFSSIPGVFAGQWLASPFQTGPDAARLDSITLLERTFWVDGSFWVMVYSDDNGLPDAVVSGGNLTGPAQPPGDAFLTYSATQPVLLDPNTRYWIVAASDNTAAAGGGYGWGWTASRNYTSPVGWSLYDYFVFTQDGGASWISTETASGRNPLLLGISGATIPEPGTPLIGLTLGLFFLRGRYGSWIRGPMPR
jgi:hypothetical protein